MAFRVCHHSRVLSQRTKRGLVEKKVMEQYCWPDGESWMDQEILVADMFVIIRDETERTLNRG